MRSDKVTFEGSQGQLAARLDQPIGKPAAFALFAHCFTCSKDIFAASRIAASLASLGIAVLRFDFTGLGASEGEFANTNFSSNVEDLLKAVAFLRHSHEAPKILIGHSLGGAAVLAAAGQVPEAAAVATIGAPFDPAHVSHNFADAIDQIEAAGEAQVTLAGRSFRVRKQFLEDIASQDQATRIAELKKALMVFHAPLDGTVGIDNATNIFVTAKHPKSFVSLDDADHLLTGRAHAVHVARVLAAWAARYIGEAGTTDIRSRFRRGDGEVLVAEAGTGFFTQTIDANGHRLVADEPFDYGGDNTGPSPYDLLTAGLGACTTMTMRMYARHKELPVEHLSVKLRHEKIHAKDCTDCETKEGRIDRITREIEIVGDLTEEQRQGLLRIADKCPVHRTLHAEVKIDTALAE